MFEVFTWGMPEFSKGKIPENLNQPLFHREKRKFDADNFCCLDGGLGRDIPRNYSPEIAENGNIQKEVVDNPELRARMKELFDWILQYFELHTNDEEDKENL